MLKHIPELLSNTSTGNLQAKWQWQVKYPNMEAVLVQWFCTNQGKVNMSGNLLKEQGAVLLDHLYPDHRPF